MTTHNYDEDEIDQAYYFMKNFEMTIDYLNTNLLLE